MPNTNQHILTQTHYFQTIITTTNISIITFFQSFTHIIHYPFIKSNITIKHYQFCVTHTIPSQRNDIHFTQHSLSFISHYSTIFYYHLFIPIQYYWIQSRGYHYHHSLLISFISYFHLYLHSHIISILFISHNSSSSLSFSSPTTSICYDFVRIVSVVFKYPFYHLYDCCWL